ncbi:MAG: hypothetical protein WBG10_06330 [Pseudolabrys sp.]
MVCRTVCAGLATLGALGALVAMSTVAASDSSDLRPIGICVDGPDTGNFVGRAVWTSCNNAEDTARRKARGFAEGFARSGCTGGLTLAQGTKVCGARGGILIRTTPYLSNTDSYAISISVSQGFCSRIQDGLMPPPTLFFRKEMWRSAAGVVAWFVDRQLAGNNSNHHG